MALSGGNLRRLVFGIPDGETRFDRRGFDPAEPSVRLTRQPPNSISCCGIQTTMLSRVWPPPK